ncbi:MAG: pantetheine-phosphate adenylyltransferase [Oscillospiraceae bacterium]|nr:pantetheine-phosphate adenylyltransferase [Oscillospiraceae bacterium]
MKLAICSGSFDPITNGHIDIIKRAAKMFDRLIVLVSVNYKKASTFTSGERVAMIERVLAELDLPNVSVDMYDGLLVNYAKQVGATALVRGLRAVTDFEYEFQMALTNKKLCGDVETIFLTTSSEYMFLSSSIVKQVVHFGGSITDFVPACIYEDIIKKLK